MSVLETARLILRRPTPEDVPALVALLGDFSVTKNLSRVPHPYTAEAGYAFVTLAGQNWTLRKDFPVVVIRRADNVLIGGGGVHPMDEFEMGYWLGRPYWAQGYATEAGRALVRFAFEELGAERLNAGWFFDNPASARVLEKLGFVPDGEDLRRCLSRGGEVLCHKVVLTRADYHRRKDQR